MAKKVTKVLKLQIPGGAAVPGQQLGPVLGAAGINIGEFVKRFNEETKDRRGETVPTVVDVYDDRTYKLTYKVERECKPPFLREGRSEPPVHHISGKTESSVFRVCTS